MKKKKFPVINTGAASVLTVFVILAMVAFALLTYMTARKNAAFSQDFADAARAYLERRYFFRDSRHRICIHCSLRGRERTASRTLRLRPSGELRLFVPDHFLYPDNHQRMGRQEHA